MSIKTRLLLSYIAMTVIPVVLFVAIAPALAAFFAKDPAVPGGRWPAFHEAFEERSELVAGVKYMLRSEPDRLSDSGFLQRIDGQLGQYRTGIVVTRNGRVSYASAGMDGDGLYARLQQLPAARDPVKWVKSEQGDRYSAERLDMTFADGSSGTVYLLSDVNMLADGAAKLFPLLALSLLLVVGLTNGALTFFVSRSLVKPLYALKRAAERMKDGDLSEEVNLRRKDEIGELGSALENMRGRLNESTRLQLQYEENRKELISHISHDLKTPITGIQACLEGIRDGIADTEQKRDKYMGMIAKKTEDMNRLIDELFLFSRLDLNKLPFQLESVNVAAYLRDCAEELRLDPRLARIHVSFVTSAESPVYVMADREKLHRVVMNIAENSLKYMNKPDGELRLELSANEQIATVAVTDNGAGIGSGALPHIFDRFYRAEPSRNSATGGSGLGLAIVKQIVEGHGGAVRAESRIGEGTSIYFTLPIDQLRR